MAYPIISKLRDMPDIFMASSLWIKVDGFTQSNVFQKYRNMAYNWKRVFQITKF